MGEECAGKQEVNTLNGSKWSGFVPEKGTETIYIAKNEGDLLANRIGNQLKY